MRLRADVAFCIHKLARRLAKTHNWIVALKTLIVIHRTLREGDPTFWEELLNFQPSGSIFQMSNFKDDSSPIAWDCSAWVRTYALFLEERLECFRILKYDNEAERLAGHAQGLDKGYSQTRDLDNEELLEQLPALQKLLYRLIGCRAEGAAVGNYLIQYALAMVLKESFKIYCSINEGIINLVDKFFEMPRHEAIKALDIYRQADLQAISLSDFYEACKGLELARNFQFPVLREPPQSFIGTMEEYIREAPRIVPVKIETLEYPERLMLTYKQEELSLPHEDIKVTSEEPKQPPPDDILVSNANVVPPPHSNKLDTEDLLGLNIGTTDASATVDNSVLALAIVPSASTPFDSDASQANDQDPTGWELALISTPSNNLSSSHATELPGGLDSLNLSSSYDEVEASYRLSEQPAYGTPAPNPFEVGDPFTISNSITPSAVQVAAFTQDQTNPFTPFQPEFPEPQQQEHLSTGAPQNPFLATDMGLSPHPSNPAAFPQAQATNPFGSSSALPF